MLFVFVPVATVGSLESGKKLLRKLCFSSAMAHPILVLAFVMAVVSTLVGTLTIVKSVKPVALVLGTVRVLHYARACHFATIKAPLKAGTVFKSLLTFAVGKIVDEFSL